MKVYDSRYITKYTIVTLTLLLVVLAVLSHRKSNFSVLAHLDTNVVIASIKE